MKITIATFTLAVAASLAVLPPVQRGALAGSSEQADSEHITKAELDHTSFCAIGRKPGCNIKLAVARGLFPTGLQPKFAPGVKCRGIDETYAMTYTFKRDREAYHGGIDMPAPFGTPIRAAAAGTVVGVYNGKGHRGIQLILRHTPEETGIPFYIYTVYAHFQKMPHFSVGDRVRMGQVLGPTGNTGRTRAHRPEGRPDGQPRGGQSGRDRGAAGLDTSGVRRGNGHGQRRPAIHFAVYYSASPKYASLGGIVIPRDGYWMDPVALFRANPPFDSAAMRSLPASAKHVPIPYLLADGSVHPQNSKLVWPYACGR